MDCGFLQRPSQLFAHYLDLRNPITLSERSGHEFGEFIDCYVGAADLEKESDTTSEEYTLGMAHEKLVKAATRLRRCSSFTRFMPDRLPHKHMPLLHAARQLRMQRWNAFLVLIAATVGTAVGAIVGSIVSG